MGVRSLFLVCAIIAGSAVVIQLDAFSDVRKSAVSFVHQTFSDVFQTCPYHVAENVLHKLGFGSKETSSISGFDGYSAGGIQIIKYETDRLFTKQELSEYVGERDSPGLYIGILGRVYDVKNGEKHYGPGNAYHFFTGCDGTKAFMTGLFNKEGLIDEVIGLTSAQMLELEDWMEFYDTTYTYKGKVIGNFYDEAGRPTEALLEAMDLIDAAQNKKKEDDELRKKFPPCNSAHSSEGGWVSCSDRSGGIKRDWVGVPRKYHTPGRPNPHCVCVRAEGAPHDNPDSDLNHGDLDNPHLETYSNCDSMSDACKIS